MPVNFNRQKMISNGIVVICLLTAAVMFYIWYSQPRLAEKASISCQDSVKQQLNSAAKVVFPDFNKIVAQRINTELTLKGYFDLPDSSGSIRRGYFTCVLILFKNTKSDGSVQNYINVRLG